MCSSATMPSTITMVCLSARHFAGAHQGSTSFCTPFSLFLILTNFISLQSNFNAHEVYPNVYVGDVYAAHNSNELKKQKITHVVNVACGVAPAYPDVCIVFFSLFLFLFLF